MLSAHGPVLAPATFTAGMLALVLSPHRRPVVLAPSDDRGWFGGTHIACWDPVSVIEDVTPAEAAEMLEEVMRGAVPLLAAAVMSYEGSAEVRTYAGGVLLAPDGWRAWGVSPDLPALPQQPLQPVGAPLLEGAVGDLDERAFCARVQDVRERIAAGDVYVLNLTYRITGRPVLDSAHAFVELLERAGGPMSAWWGDSHRSLASASPERFCAVERDDSGITRAWIEPIKGTRPRGANPLEDAELAQKLADDAKERSEHVMVVDLERNDLGRVSVAGSVRVHPMFEVFAMPYCHQLVSRVRSTLRADATLADLVESTFPCGSVTGAPKLAAMRIIGELEMSPRGAYTGALAVAVPGQLDSAVLIRTLEYAGPETARWGTGCGITIDSDPKSEWCESLLKASPVTGKGGSR
ncbi:MAG: anthranilate synthase component I family protein [Coriobacteriia bacterium]|nr:anthranilate synthase component I family protein [Coriobacteriia bacterium]